MFTGIIEDVGKIREANSSKLIIETKLTDVKPGDSVSVNGVCLTITSFDKKTFSVDVSRETYDKTNLGGLKSGDKVNLERALRLQDRIGGHFVTGHVECIGKIRAVKPGEDRISRIVWLICPDTMKKYIVKKGSVAVDGISLTIVDVTETEFSVVLIPFTLNNTMLGTKNTGDTVNIEPDILAKYVQQSAVSEKKGVTEEFLKKHGF
jgi:riboflavin synthase